MTNEIESMQNVREYFDKDSLRWRELYYDKYYASNKVLNDRKNYSITFLSKYLKPDSRILDAGCGAGEVSLDAVRRGYSVHGIDISEKMIHLCNQTFSKIGIDSTRYQFTVDDITKGNIPNNSYDGILAIGFLEYQKDELKTLKILHNTLRSKGILICTGPIKTRITNLFGLGITIENNFSRAYIRNPHMINMYSLSRFRKLLESSGFTFIDYKRHGYADFYQLIWLSRLIRKELVTPKRSLMLHNGLTKISKIFPIDQFANDIIVVARKD
ncbi:class I SAM-dependent methyltransferase [Thermoproteota archaeon]